MTILEEMVFKTKRTFFTEEKIANAVKNIAQHSWAKQTRDHVVAEAEKYSSYGCDFLWNSVTAQNIPRSYGVNQTLGCPVCKKDIDLYGNYPWIGDPVNHPWKLTCPSCQSVFPSNDFAAYYKSGKDGRGSFNPDLADRSLLTNTLYPDKGENWCVDDGYGWLDPDNDNKETRRYTFIAYYNHWNIWYGGGFVSSAVQSLSEAYLYTGEPRYACAGTVLLDRIADVYPEMDSSVFKWEDGFRNSHGLSGLGKIIGSIWETGLAKTFIQAYDALFTGMDQPEAIEFLNKKALQSQKENLKNSVEAIRHNIEHGILRQIHPAIEKYQICGNMGMHQSALALAAVVLNDPAKSREWIEYIFKTQSKDSWGGGNILKTLVNDVDRDGHGDEAAPYYNSFWLDNLKLVADALIGSEKYAPVNLYDYPKFKKLSHMIFPLIVLGAYTPSIGDTKKAGNPGIVGIIQTHVSMFEKTGDPLLAQFVYFQNGNKLEGIHGEIFSNTDKLCGEIQTVIDTYGTFKQESTNITGYGFTALRDGTEENMQAATLYYGRNNGHGHKDALNLGIYAFGLDLSPDHGYPCFADRNLERRNWTINTLSHNTVMVDRSMQGNHVAGIPHHYSGSGKVKLIDVEAPLVYPQTKLYRRTTAVISIDGGNSYIVDFFRVKGGEEHIYSFHGAEGEATAGGLRLVKQAGGTYAGEDISFKDASFDQAYASGFNYLYNVERDSNPQGAFSVDWNVKDTWNVHPQQENIHLRLTMLTEVNDVALADGEPPQNKPGNPKSFRYLLARRKGANLQSQFVSVLEPYKGNRTVYSITSVAVKKDGGVIVDSEDVYAVKVTLANGRTDYVVNALNPGVIYTVDDLFEFKGFLGVCSFDKEEPVYAYVCDGTLLKLRDRVLIGSFDKGSLTGEVCYFTKEMSAINEITVRLHETHKGKGLSGKFIHIENDGIRNAVYEIKGVRENGEQLVLEIGDTTLIRSWVDDFDFTKGYINDIEEGARFCIPLSGEWNKTYGVDAVGDMGNEWSILNDRRENSEV